MVNIMNSWVWLPHPAHFIGSDECRFRLATVVGRKKKYIVSTVGEYYTEGRLERLGADENSYYETYVFEAIKSNISCCKYKIQVEKQVDGIRCENAKEANKNHIKMCKKWDK